MKDLKVKISGTSGQGIISAGDILSYATARKGYYVTTFRAFPSEIRGDGKCYYTLRISENRRLTATGETDILVCLDEETIYEGLKKVAKGSVLIYDSELVPQLKESRDDIVVYGIPLTTIAKDKINNVVLVSSKPYKDGNRGPFAIRQSRMVKGLIKKIA